MTTLLTMLPFYLFGNIHCMGMCGPLVMMLGCHRYRYLYFLGRTLSFTLAGAIAGEIGAVVHFFLHQIHFSAFASFFFGGVIFYAGFTSLTGQQYFGYHYLSRKMAHVTKTLSALILQDRMWPTFFFGFLTVALPCGQSLIVFSACALSGNVWTGIFNGFIFALLTSPSLLVAMHAKAFLAPLRKYERKVIAVSAFIAGTLALCRGFAEMEIIPHLVLGSFHIVIY